MSEYELTPQTIYIVATPIGNLADLSPRALHVLRNVDFIAAEDTRHSGHLFKHFSIKTKSIALHDFNETSRVEQLLENLSQGQNMALISDAGTPLISDPGFALVSQARNAGFKVVPIPGPCAAIAALSVAGLPTDRFCFEGFLPAKASQRQKRLQQLAAEPRTMVFYEAPHRILGLFTDLSTELGAERNCVIARELTKTFETIHAATAQQCLEWLQSDPMQQKGEFVVIVSGYKSNQTDSLSEATKQTLSVLLQELPLKTAAKLTAQLTGAAKNEIYKYGLEHCNKANK